MHTNFRLARDHEKSVTQLEQKTVAQQAVIANTQQVGISMVVIKREGKFTESKTMPLGKSCETEVITIY